MSVESGVKADLKSLPKELRESGLAEGCLAIAKAMDAYETPPSDMASCLRALQAALDRLRELAPSEEEADAVNDIEDQRAKRLARVSRAASKSRS